MRGKGIGAPKHRHGADNRCERVHMQVQEIRENKASYWVGGKERILMGGGTGFKCTIKRDTHEPSRLRKKPIHYKIGITNNLYI